MILSYNPNNEEGDLNKSKDSELSNLSSIQKGKIKIFKLFLDNSQFSTNSNRDISNDNIIVFDVKYSEIFRKKNKKQNDEVFYEKFQDLKIIGNMDKKSQIKSEISYSHDDSQVSFKEENFFNAEIIKMINSTNMKEKHSRSNSLNISSHGEIYTNRNLKKNSTNQIFKYFKNEENKKEPSLDKVKQFKDSNRIQEKLEDNKNIESANVSLLSDLSQGSRKNYIPKELIFAENSLDKSSTYEKNDLNNKLNQGIVDKRNASYLGNKETVLNVNLQSNLHNPYSYYDMNIERIIEKPRADYVNLSFEENIKNGNNIYESNEIFSQYKKTLNPSQNNKCSSSNLGLLDDSEISGNKIQRKSSSNINISNNKNFSNFEHGVGMNSNDSNIFGAIHKNIPANNFPPNTNSRTGKECLRNPPININKLNSATTPDDPINTINQQNMNKNFFNNMSNYNMNKNYPQNSSINMNMNSIANQKMYTQGMPCNKSLNPMNMNNLYQKEFGFIHNEYHSPKSEQISSSVNLNFNQNKFLINNQDMNKLGNQKNITRQKNNQLHSNRYNGQGNKFVNISINNNNINNTTNNNNLNKLYGLNVGNIFEEANFFESPVHFNLQTMHEKRNMLNIPYMTNMTSLNSSPSIFQNQYLPTSIPISSQIPSKNPKVNQQFKAAKIFADNFDLNPQPIFKETFNNAQTHVSSHTLTPNNNGPPTVNNKKKIQKFQKLNLKFEDLNDEELAHLSLQIAKDQAGCRFLQKKIEQSPKYANDVLFPEIYDNLDEFMTDSFGNYLIQKTIENIDDNKLELIIKFIHPNFLDLGLNPHGTRVLQKVIECVKKENQLDYFNKIFEPHIVELMKDVNGNHIIIKYVNTIKYPKNQFLYDAVADNTIELATNKHACCAFQKCINNATESQRKILIERIIENTYILISDAYGNYLIQFVLSINDYETNYKIMTYFKNQIGYLSKQKFSSNVIEKCFDHCDKKTIDVLVKEICNPKLISDLLLDMYGNYVLQKALSSSEGPCRLIFIKTIGINLEKLKTKNFGLKLINKLIITYPEFNQLNSNTYMNQKNQKQIYTGIGNGNYNYINFSENYPSGIGLGEREYSNVNTNHESNVGVSRMNNMHNGYLRNKNSVYDNNSYSNFHS